MRAAPTAFRAPTAFQERVNWPTWLRSTALRGLSSRKGGMALFSSWVSSAGAIWSVAPAIPDSCLVRLADSRGGGCRNSLGPRCDLFSWSSCWRRQLPTPLAPNRVSTLVVTPGSPRFFSRLFLRRVSFSAQPFFGPKGALGEVERPHVGQQPRNRAPGWRGRSAMPSLVFVCLCGTAESCVRSVRSIFSPLGRRSGRGQLIALRKTRRVSLRLVP